MIKTTALGVISVFVLCGFSDSAERDLARCKLKAIELYRPPADEGSWKLEPLVYVRTCMEAAGYQWNQQDADCAYGAGSTFDWTFVGRCWH